MFPYCSVSFSGYGTNAQDLIEEAELLLKNNKNARAFALAHLASEELVKLLNGKLALRHAHFEVTQRTFLAHLKPSLLFSVKFNLLINGLQYTNKEQQVGD